MENYLLGCDWGTSSFRLRLISIPVGGTPLGGTPLGGTPLGGIPHHQLIGEVISQEGIISTFDAWKTEGENKGIPRNEFFRQQLKKQIDVLAAKLAICLDHITVVISGMASSSVGMEEVPYARLPFALDGSQASIWCSDRQDEFPHDIILISGVRSQHDVMRGEETQLIGLMGLLDFLGNQHKEVILIFPGTHSKHVYIRDNQMIHFQTFMTGEVFHLMANYSILKDSVGGNGVTEFTECDLDAFRLGLKASEASNILNGLFTVRTNQLFGKLNRKQNSFYLSGLLIGSELKHLIDKENNPLVLCSGSNLHEFYKLAIEELHLFSRTTNISADLVDKAAITGQLRIFQNQISKLKRTTI